MYSAEKSPSLLCLLPGPPSLCGTLVVLADGHEGHSTKGNRTAGNSTRKLTASAAAHHSYGTGHQPSGRQSVHSPSQQTQSYGDKHAVHWRWNGLP